MNKDKRKEIKNNYKLTERPIGIYKISNHENDIIFVGKSLNLDGAINSSVFQLKNKSHKNKKLQDLWNLLGEDKFNFQIIDKLDVSEDMEKSRVDELDYLLEVWINKLEPFAEKEYK